MANFTPNGTVIISTNGKVITFTDTSENPPDNIAKRKLIVTDGRNDSLTIIEIPSGAQGVSFALNKKTDQVLNITLLWYDEDGTEYRNVITKMTKQFFVLAVLYDYENPRCKKRGCGCSDTVKAEACMRAAEAYFKFGNLESAQNALDAVRAYLTPAPDGYADTITKTLPVNYDLPEDGSTDDPYVFVGNNQIYINNSPLTF